jgi:hypothetical protein
MVPGDDSAQSSTYARASAAPRGLMRRPGIWLSLLAVLIFFVLSPVFAWHACGKCPGPFSPATDTKFEGPAGTAVIWRSVQRLEHATVGPIPEFRCYERTVTNDGVKAVLDVVWDVAAFWKARIPGKTAMCDALGTPGSLAKPDPAGPLFYGPGRQRIDTQVYTPTSGWPARQKAVTMSTDVFPFKDELVGRTLHLSSGVSFPQPALLNAAATLTLSSEVQYVDPRNYKYTYVVAHDAKDPIQITWSIVTDRDEIHDQLRDYILSVKRSMILSGGKPVTFTFTSNEPPIWGIGPVVIKDRAGQPLASGTASSYGPRNGTAKDSDQ